MADEQEPKLTPTEDLVMEVLAARWRLGERLWTFDSKIKKQLTALAEIGYVEVMHGIVENTLRASLTERGKKAFVKENYEPPILRDFQNALIGLVNPVITATGNALGNARLTVGWIGPNGEDVEVEITWWDPAKKAAKKSKGKKAKAKKAAAKAVDT